MASDPLNVPVEFCFLASISLNRLLLSCFLDGFCPVLALFFVHGGVDELKVAILFCHP
jgi:hypothetical protein